MLPTTEPQLSIKDAEELLSTMSEADIAQLKQYAIDQRMGRLKSIFKLPHEGKHNHARKLRARARIAKRKAKKKA